MICPPPRSTLFPYTTLLRSTCTVFVKDNISPGTASTPAGSVAITKGGTATGTFIFCSNQLTVVNSPSVSCTAVVSPSTTGTITATGVYTPSDNVHSTSTSPVSNTVTVGLRATSTEIGRASCRERV